jgi:uncharacterized membrane protein YeiH
MVSGFLTGLDLVGTFVFALSGAVAGVKHRLDLFGVIVLAFAAATAGGISRDVLIGASPPAAIIEWPYFATSLAAALITFLRFNVIGRLNESVLLFDAAGLALFAVSGSLKALAYGVTPGAAILLGVLTGVGGGIVRDVLVREIPIILHSELYAVAAAAGAALAVGAHEAGLEPAIGGTAGAVLCFAVRLLAIRRGWRLPVSPWSDSRKP